MTLRTIKSVLGLIFLKYVSDAFEERQNELRKAFRDPKHDYAMPREDYASDVEYEQAITNELEIRDYYQERNVFWVPEHARWKYLQATVPHGHQIRRKFGYQTHGHRLPYQVGNVDSAFLNWAKELCKVMDRAHGAN